MTGHLYRWSCSRVAEPSLSSQSGRWDPPRELVAPDQRLWLRQWATPLELCIQHHSHTIKKSDYFCRADCLYRRMYICMYVYNTLLYARMFRLFLSRRFCVTATVDLRCGQRLAGKFVKIRVRVAIVWLRSMRWPLRSMRLVNGFCFYMEFLENFDGLSVLKHGKSLRVSSLLICVHVYLLVPEHRIMPLIYFLYTCFAFLHVQQALLENKNPVSSEKEGILTERE